MYYLIIPAFEPDQKLLALLEDVRQQLHCQVILVNDGSSLHTKPIFKEASQLATILGSVAKFSKKSILV